MPITYFCRVRTLDASSHIEGLKIFCLCFILRWCLLYERKRDLHAQCTYMVVRKLSTSLFRQKCNTSSVLISCRGSRRSSNGTLHFAWMFHRRKLSCFPTARPPTFAAGNTGNNVFEHVGHVWWCFSFPDCTCSLKRKLSSQVAHPLSSLSPCMMVHQHNLRLLCVTTSILHIPGDELAEL